MHMFPMDVVVCEVIDIDAKQLMRYISTQLLYLWNDRILAWCKHTMIMVSRCVIDVIEAKYLNYVMRLVIEKYMEKMLVVIPTSDAK